MSSMEGKMAIDWKKPDELIKLHRLRQKKKQLTARLQTNSSRRDDIPADKTQLLEAVISQKRKNSFIKSCSDTKKPRIEKSSLIEEDSLLKLIYVPSVETNFVDDTATQLTKPAISPVEDEVPVDQQKFSKYLPMDWSLKTRLRFFSRTDMPTTTLKSNQMASGLTGFVRCIDMQNASNGLDISPATRLNQATYYWQQPHLPWMTLFPRNAKENIGLTLGERERRALMDDWDCSFRGLFQLVRARQCPYFYFCANTFTVLFRAAGTGGCEETHALVTPTTRGIRSALKQEGIEYTMPLKKDSNLNKSGDDGSLGDQQSGSKVLPVDSLNGSVSLIEVPHATDEKSGAADDDDEEEEEEDERWLESLGVDDKEIRRIHSAELRREKSQEMSDDFSDSSLVLIEGVECQGLFSFLLNAKSTVTSVGRLAGVPPTLLAPVAFPKATMEHLAVRSSKVRMDGVDYASIELKGVILPTVLPYVFHLLKESKDKLSATLATSTVTMAFSKATQKLLEDSKQVKEIDETGGQVFGQENLSDCGLLTEVIEAICRTGKNAVGLLENVCFDKDFGYVWS